MIIMKPKHIHHVFFPISEEIVSKGIIRFGATEATIYCLDNLTPDIPDFIEKDISIHKNIISSNYQDAIEQIQENLEDLLCENMLLCVNLNNCNPILSQASIIYLTQLLKRFHSKDRPSLEPYATIMYYHISGNIIEGYPLIPQSPETYSIIFRTLSKNQEWMSKADIQNQITIVDDYVSDYQITNALITLENWLKFYPGFEVRQKKQRKKEYIIRDLTKF